MAKADVRDMAIVHRAFRRTYPEAAQLIRDSAVAGSKRVAFLTDHVRFALTSLHHHHAAEDEHLFPLLLERCPAHADEIASVEAQHQALAAGLERTEQALGRWAARPADASRTELADALDQLTGAVDEHLDAEERLVVPLAAEWLTQQEWDELSAAGRAGLPPGRLLLAFGAMLEPLSDSDQAYMLGQLPAPARLMWKLVGRRNYAKYRRTLLQSP